MYHWFFFISEYWYFSLIYHLNVSNREQQSTEEGLCWAGGAQEYGKEA